MSGRIRRTTDPFVVPVDLELDGVQGVEYLKADRTLGPESTAVRFTVATSPSPRDLVVMERARYVLAGGREAWRDLDAGAREDAAVVHREVERHLWPEGRPAPLHPEDEKAQGKAMQDCWAEWDSPAKWGLDAAQKLLGTYQFQAEWEAMVVDPPVGWARIPETLETGLYFALWAAYQAALEGARAKKG